MAITQETVSVLCGGGHTSVYSIHVELDNWIDNRDNGVSPCYAYERLLQDTDADVIIYIHDDVTIHDPNWRDRVLSLFSNPDCVCVGLGGATGLGHPDLYKVAYRLPYMARSGYVSNQTDWAVHGGHEEGNKHVAVVDAFLMAVRTDWLRGVGGWPIGHITHHCLDLWVACEAARTGKQVWMAGASCTHHGGGSSTKPTYGAAKWLLGGSLQSDHQAPHKWLYEEYRDVLPIMPIMVNQ